MGRGYCFGCMEVIDAYPCPYCGHSGAAEDKPYALRAGTILKGRYLVGKVLGQGGFGITYIGMDLQLQRKLAIKEYYPSSYACRQDNLGTVHWYSKEIAQEARMSGRELFLKEARKMSRVSHIPEVVQVYDLFQENDTAYICMDYIDGITLMNRLKTDGPMSWEEAKGIFLPAMTVLDQVHKAGLVHRDISPDNIMLQRDGSIRILDLGAAKDLQVNTGQSSMQVAKSGFSPPEQYMQRGNSGSWTDVYAMAATMYYALTGKLPLPAMDRMNPEGDTLYWNIPQLQALPKTALRALKHAMALKISDRTQTMKEFSEGLAAGPDQKTSPTPGPKPEPKPTPKPTPKPKPMPRSALMAAAAVLLLVISGFLLKPMFAGGKDLSAETSPEQLQATTETTLPVPQEEAKPVSVAAGAKNTVILMSDGTVRAYGDNLRGQRNVSEWTNIAAVSTTYFTIGIQNDDKVIVAGMLNLDEKQGQGVILDWSDVTAIESGWGHTTALKADGTIVAAGSNTYGQCDVSNWTDIVAIDAAYDHTVGLKSNGTVVATGSNSDGQCDINDWDNIIAVSTGKDHTVGLKADGTVVAVGANRYGECDISDWQDVVAISVGINHTVGLTRSGEVLVAGSNDYSQCEVSQWKNVVAIDAGYYHTVGITADGEILASGDNTYGQCDIDLSQ